MKLKYPNLLVFSNTFFIIKLHKELIMADETLDASGLNCPLPILKTKKALSKMSAGQILEVISTDAGSVKDIEAFCNQTGNKLISNVEDGGKFVFTIEKV
jgi:tRNA 2-thiouridine synthesizing protein A